MRHLSHYDSTTYRGSGELAPNHGNILPVTSSPWLDGPSGAKIECPSSVEEYGLIGGGGRGWPVPNALYLGTELSGSLIDLGQGGHNLSATGAVLYNQTAPTGWAGPWIGTTAASAGFRTALETLYDPMMPVFCTIDANITSTGGTRTLITLCPNVLIGFNAAGQITITVTGSTTVTGTFDYRAAQTVYRIVVYMDFARPVPIVTVATEKERLTVTAGGGPGGILTFPGDGTKGLFGASTSAPAGRYRRFAIWRGGPARTCGQIGGTDLGNKTFLQHSRCNVIY